MRQTLLAFVLTAASAGAAWAAPVPHRGACGPDIQRYCASATPGDSLQACLEKNLDSLAPACKENVRFLHDQNQQILQVQDDFKKACAKDVTRFCAGVKPGDARIGQCLDRHSADVSADCKTLLDQTQQLREGQ